MSDKIHAYAAINKGDKLKPFIFLRHSFNSALANAGVSQELRMKLTGHSSVEMNAHYSHHELETVRKAIESISRLPGKNLRAEFCDCRSIHFPSNLRDKSK